MPAATTISMKLTFAPIAKALMKGPAVFNAELRKQYSVAGRTAGLKLAAIMRQKIQGGIPPPNAQMTIDIKGSSKPLVDSGRLFKAITSESGGSVKDFNIRVGVKRSHKLANVAAIVHDGRKQTVTRRQQVLFRALYFASIGRKITVRSARGRALLSEAKGVITPIKEGETLVIPPRPFAAETLNDPRARQIVEAEFRNALKRTFEALK